MSPLAARLAAPFLALAFLAAGPAAALTVLGPASVLPGARAVAALFTARTGIAVTVSGGSRDKVQQALAAGAGDVVLLPSTDFPALTAVAGMTPIGSVPVGVAVKAGAPVPDISTPEKFLAVLRRAKGVAYADPSAGTSAGVMLDGLLKQPEYHDVHRVPVKGLAVTGLTSGQADIALQLLPELASNPAVTLVGPMPASISVDIAAGIVATGMDTANAQAFIAFAASREAAAAWKAGGIHPLVQ